jgi:hypothetical protein
LVAVTLHVYGVSFVNPVTMIGEDPLLATKLSVPSVQLAVNWVTGEPPSSPAVKYKYISPSPESARTLTGLDGVEGGTKVKLKVKLKVSEAGLEPAKLVATVEQP